MLNFADYYPFGWKIPARKAVTAGFEYRFGYQGQFAEEDAETGWSYFNLRMYDGRLGRWMSPDPFYQHFSGYMAMGNNPIMGIDPDGGNDIYPDDFIGPLNQGDFRESDVTIHAYSSPIPFINNGESGGYGSGSFISMPIDNTASSTGVGRDFPYFRWDFAGGIQFDGRFDDLPGAYTGFKPTSESVETMSIHDFILRFGSGPISNRPILGTAQAFKYGIGLINKGNTISGYKQPGFNHQHEVEVDDDSMIVTYSWPGSRLPPQVKPKTDTSNLSTLRRMNYYFNIKYK